MKTQRTSLIVLPLVAAGIAFSAPAARADQSVQVVLHLKEKANIEELAKSVTDPQSPRFRIFYTPEEIRQIAGPSDYDYNKLITQLKNDGAVIVKESPTHLYVTVRAEKSYLQNFQTQNRFANFALSSIEGLNPSHARHPHLKFNKEMKSFESTTSSSGMLPASIHQLYDLNGIYKSGITGKGQHIAIATYDSFYIDDVNQYFVKNAISPVPQVDIVSFNGNAVYAMGSAAETQTDAEFSGMIAPGAAIHVFTSAENSDAGELAMFTAILDDNRAKVVNYSWGMCETQASDAHKADMDKVFARAVAQGVNILVASGDSGSDCLANGTASPDFPASNPNIVSVGGTTLSDSHGLASELAWSGSGGGVSVRYATPAYQAHVTLAGAALTHRSYPDIAFNADPKSGQPTWVHYDPYGDTPADASYVVIGGTSIAAPQWAGFLALVGEARAATSPLGFLNPVIYGTSTADQATYFHDVTSGNNGAYKAAQGWDAVTGLGSMKGQAMFEFLRNH